MPRKTKRSKVRRPHAEAARILKSSKPIAHRIAGRTSRSRGQYPKSRGLGGQSGGPFRRGIRLFCLACAWPFQWVAEKRDSAKWLRFLVRLRVAIVVSQTEGMGFEPATPFEAPDFEFRQPVVRPCSGLFKAFICQELRSRSMSASVQIFRLNLMPWLSIPHHLSNPSQDAAAGAVARAIARPPQNTRRPPSSA